MTGTEGALIFTVYFLRAQRKESFLKRHINGCDFLSNEYEWPQRSAPLAIIHCSLFIGRSPFFHVHCFLYLCRFKTITEMRLIDTHIHWYVNDFDTDLPEAVARAQAVGVEKFILPAVNRSTQAPLMRVAEAFPGICFPCTGLHPTEVNEHWRSELDFVAEQLSTASSSFIAVGETGIDAHRSREFIEEQKTVFEQQLRWSVRYDLPVIIHARDAFDEIFEVLRRVAPLPLRGVFHAYSGDAPLFERLLRYGDFKIGAGGVVTFKNALLAQAVAQLDLRHIVLETDAPWLAPVPHRGRRNESSTLPLVVAKIAALKQCSPEEVAAITTANAETLFKLN
jgi:TatD DNase family protein